MASPPDHCKIVSAVTKLQSHVEEFESRLAALNTYILETNTTKALNQCTILRKSLQSMVKAIVTEVEIMKIASIDQFKQYREIKKNSAKLKMSLRMFVQ